MSDATTGKAHANARVSTMPKLSPPSDGATSAFVRASRAVSSSCGEEAEDVDPVVGDAQPREEEPDRERVGAADLEPRAGAPVDLGPGAQQHLQALPGLLAAGERDRVLAARGIDGVGDEDAVRDDLVVAGKPPWPPSRAPARRRRSAGRSGSRGSPRRASRASSSRARPRRGGSRRSAQVAIASTEMQVTGVIGSCRWSTSKRSRSSTRLIRKIARGLRMMFGSDPFAGTITERPIGITFAGGSPWRPTRGCRARVN